MTQIFPRRAKKLGLINEYSYSGADQLRGVSPLLGLHFYLFFFYGDFNPFFVILPATCCTYRGSSKHRNGICCACHNAIWLVVPLSSMEKLLYNLPLQQEAAEPVGTDISNGDNWY